LKEQKIQSILAIRDSFNIQIKKLSNMVNSQFDQFGLDQKKIANEDDSHSDINSL